MVSLIGRERALIVGFRFFIDVCRAERKNSFHGTKYDYLIFISVGAVFAILLVGGTGLISKPEKLE